MRNRGKPKPKLTDLTRKPPAKEELEAAFAALPTATPMMVAILGAALTEHDLEEAIRGRLTVNDDETWSALLEPNGPLSSFSSKIDMAFALGALEKNMRELLHTIRRIRNAYAHSKKIITFENDLILKEIRSLALLPKSKSRKKIPAFCMSAIKNPNINGEEAYFTLLCGASVYFSKLKIETLKRQSSHLKRKIARKTASEYLERPSNGLLQLMKISNHPESLGDLAKSFLENQTDDLKRSTRTSNALGLLGELFPTDSESNDSKNRKS